MSGEEDRSRDREPGRRGILSWMESKSSRRLNAYAGRAMSSISAMISSLDLRMGERMRAIPLYVVPILSSGRVLGERLDVDVSSVAEWEVEEGARGSPRVEVILVIIESSLLRVYDGGKLSGTGKDRVQVEGFEGLSWSGETCLSTLLSRALPVTAQLNRKGALCDPR